MTTSVYDIPGAVLDIVRFKLDKDIPKGARDARGRWVKTGPRFKRVRKGEDGFDEAPYAMAYIPCGPRFKVKIPKKKKDGAA